ncbi:MAG: hypothetical protein NE328_00295 [Lentisphaeraceae bacterium]|nr:hypothetical protein [Lentisphaeraceae bacterium]
MNIAQLKNNRMTGYGLFSAFRKDKKDTSKSYLELDQIGGKITIICESSELSSFISSQLSSKTIIRDETVVSYSAKVSVQPEARHGTSKAGNDYSFVGNRLAMPILESLEVAKV